MLRITEKIDFHQNIMSPSWLAPRVCAGWNSNWNWNININITFIHCTGEKLFTPSQGLCLTQRAKRAGDVFAILSRNPYKTMDFLTFLTRRAKRAGDVFAILS